MQKTNNTDGIFDKINTKSIVFKILLFVFVLIISFTFLFTINEKGYTEINNVIIEYPQQDEELNQLNAFRNRVYKLINLQQLEVYLDEDNPSEKIQDESYVLSRHLDSLKQLMSDDPVRLASINEIDSLLDSRKYIFESYLKTRLNEDFDNELRNKANEIKKILNRKIISIDTSSKIVLKYDKVNIPSLIEADISKPQPPIIHEQKIEPVEKKKRKFHLLPAFLRKKDKDTEDDKDEKRKFSLIPSFLRKKDHSDDDKEKQILTQKIKELEQKEEAIKKEKEQKIDNTPKIITEHQQQIDIIIDSIEIAKRDSALTHLQLSLLEIQSNRHKNNLELKNQEILLLNTNDLIISQILSIIKQLEDKQLVIKNQRNLTSQKLALQSIQVNKIILWVIAFLTVLLSLWLIMDFFRMNRIKNKLEKAKKEAEFHSKAKQSFLANMSHEIRTPLQSIIGFSELLSEKNDAHEIEAIGSSSKHLLHIVNEILDYDKIISGKYTFQELPFQVEQLFSEVWEICLLNPNAKRLELINDYQFDYKWLSGDGFRLKQILLNLLNNSLKYTEEGCIVLEAQTIKEKDDISLNITLTDTGIGISKDKLELIFEEYEQSSNEHQLKGSGLGLSIVKQLIQGMNGTISIQSTEGQGTSINVILPFKETQEPNDDKNDIINEINYCINANIVFIEDDPIIQQLLISFTQDYIKKSTIFNNAEEFLEKINLESIDCIISDIRLSGKMNGMDIVKEVRRRGFNTPCIAVTAQALKEEHIAILEAGFDDILIKPFTKKSLREMIFKYNSSLGSLSEEKVNFSNITQMTDNQDILQTIMDDFFQHTQQELLQIEESKPEEMEEIVLTLVHRIAGRLLQIGSTELGNQWKELEYKIRDREIQSKDDQRLKVRIKELRAEINSWNNQ